MVTWFVIGHDWPRSGIGRDDSNLSNTHEYQFRCHYLPHFNSNTDTDTNIVEQNTKQILKIRIRILT
jgi:hypothetical protein